MQTRSSSKFVGEPSTNPTSTIPKRRNRRRSIQRVKPFSLVETPVVMMADQRTMAELLRAPTEGYAEAIVVPLILAEHFELKHSLINLIASTVASAVTSAMTVMFKQHQVTPAPASVKVVEESCVTCGGAHSYRQFPATDDNIFSGYQDNIQGYVSAATMDLPFQCPPFINPEEDERAEEMLTDPKLIEMNKEKQQDKDEIQIHMFWQMFKQLHINISLADALILIPKYQKMLKALFSNKEKLLELANTPLNENCSAVILKKLPEKLGDPGKFLIPCSFSELNCKALAYLGASINLMPLSVWKKLGRFTFPADFVIVDYESDPRVPLILGRPFLRTARALIDVHGEELILRDGDERLILNMKHGTSSYSNKHQRESINMIDIYNISYEDYLEDLFANEKITNHLSGNPTFSSEPDTLTSDLTSPEVKDDIFDPEGDIVLIEKLLNLDSTKDLPPSPNVNPLSGSTTSSSPSLTTFEISDYSLEEFADELALIESFPPGNDDMTPEDVIREIEYLLNRDPLYSPNNDHIYTIPEMFTDEHTLDYSSHPRYDDADDDLFYLKIDNDVWGKIFYDDPFDSKENKIKVSKLLVDELDSTGSSSFLPHFLESDSVLYEDFSEVDTLTSTDNEDKVFNPGILVHENLYEVTNRVTPDKNVKKISSSNASLILEDYNPPLSDHELPFHIEIPGSGTLLSFSSKNEEKVFNPGILISKGVHSLLPELSHRDSKAFKVINIFESPMEIFPCSYGEDIRVLDVPLTNKCVVRRLASSFLVFYGFCCMSKIAPDYEASHARGFVLRSLELQSLA
ncbi:reverse transcriptase domain-containing protein [Tanacetum coccineum]